MKTLWLPVTAILLLFLRTPVAAQQFDLGNGFTIKTDTSGIQILKGENLNAQSKPLNWPVRFILANYSGEKIQLYQGGGVVGSVSGLDSPSSMFIDGMMSETYSIRDGSGKVIVNFKLVSTGKWAHPNIIEVRKKDFTSTPNLTMEISHYGIDHNPKKSECFNYSGQVNWDGTILRIRHNEVDKEIITATLSSIETGQKSGSITYIFLSPLNEILKWIVYDQPQKRHGFTFNCELIKKPRIPGGNRWFGMMKQ